MGTISSCSDDEYGTDEECPGNEYGHTPDMRTVTAHYEDDTVYLDVNCVDCGRSGCYGAFTTKTEVQW
jgi:hypothetical protein